MKFVCVSDVKFQLDDEMGDFFFFFKYGKQI